MQHLIEEHWQPLAEGVLKTENFHRSLGRNGYNLGILFLEYGSDDLELRVILTVYSNYAPWVPTILPASKYCLGGYGHFFRTRDNR